MYQQIRFILADSGFTKPARHPAGGPGPGLKIKVPKGH